MMHGSTAVLLAFAFAGSAYGADVGGIKLEATMKGLGDAKEGSVVTLDFVNGVTMIGFNGKPKATIAGDAFNKALTKVWLGAKPAQRDLKQALLGG